MVELIKRMWDTQPDKRPPFAQIVEELRVLQYSAAELELDDKELIEFDKDSSESSVCERDPYF